MCKLAVAAVVAVVMARCGDHRPSIRGTSVGTLEMASPETLEAVDSSWRELGYDKRYPRCFRVQPEIWLVPVEIIQQRCLAEGGRIGGCILFHLDSQGQVDEVNIWLGKELSQWDQARILVHEVVHWYNRCGYGDLDMNHDFHRTWCLEDDCVQGRARRKLFL